MERKIRIAQYGCGVKVSDAKDAVRILGELKPDVCIIATRSTMIDVKDAFTVCAKNEVNAFSTCEESLYPWNSSYEITKELDELAKAHNCTLCGSGYPDMYWGSLITTLAGSIHNLKKISGSSSYNGLSYEEAQKLIVEGVIEPSYMWNQNGWLCSQPGLHIVSQTQECIPVTHKEDLKSATLGMTIKAGNATGMSAVVTTETEEGITLETKCLGYVYGPEDMDRNERTLEGEPDTTLVVNRPATVELTCATLTNRIPMLIDAPSGYITTEKMPVNHYLVKPMHAYVRSR